MDGWRELDEELDELDELDKLEELDSAEEVVLDSVDVVVCFEELLSSSLSGSLSVTGGSELEESVPAPPPPPPPPPPQRSIQGI